MAVGPISAASPNPPPLAAALALAPRIRARAAWIDAERRLPEDLVRDLAGAGLFKMAVPRADGGGGADLLTVLRTIEAVSQASSCISTSPPGAFSVTAAIRGSVS